MPTLFISYKRGTTAVAPLMDRLKKAHYRLWFDRDEIHLGDPDWQARIDQGLMRCDGMILNITPAACASEPVRYEVRRARELGKPIFPIVLERITSYDEAIRDLGLPEKAHIEDFTEVTRWDEQIERLLRDLEEQGLRVSPHDRRAQRDRNNPKYVLHQQYLKRLVERIGTLNLAQIAHLSAGGVDLEQVYVDSPTPLNISVEIKDWQVLDWWLSEGSPDRSNPFEDVPPEARRRPDELGYQSQPLNALIGQIDQQIADYRAKNPHKKPDEKNEWSNPWNNGTKHERINLHLNHLAAARDRLVILGAPGSGKSTFVRYLALCLAGAAIDDWSRPVGINTLDNWPHGPLTPVYVELRRFVASRHFPTESRSPVTVDHLWSYIVNDLLGDALRPFADDLQFDLEHGHALLILDGLDEVPFLEGQLRARQEQLIGLAQSINSRYSTSRILVASRPYAYEGWELPGFSAVTITAFEDQHRLQLARRLYQTAGLAEEDTQSKAQSLNQQLGVIDPELKDRPLFVTLMASIYLKNQHGQGLPTRRGALYRESILLLVDRWTTSKADAPSLSKILGDSTPQDLLDRLAALAYEVHSTYGDQPGTPEIDETLLYKHLKPLGRGVAAELIPYLSENAGVLVSPGQNAERDVFHFAHRTFQEYLAAVQLVHHCTADSFVPIQAAITGKPALWRIPCALAGDVLADTERRTDLWNLLDDLLDSDVPENIAADDPRWWSLWLAATITDEHKLYAVDKATLRRGERAIRENLIDWLVGLVGTKQALPPAERADCGRALGLLDDPREGVGVKNGLPEIDWVGIPAGTFLMGSDKEKDTLAIGNETPLRVVTIEAYSISRYPITYAQYEPFVAGDGYSNEKYWTEAGWMWKGETTQPAYWNDPKWHISNHPVVGVAWSEAYAYCQWLSAKLGQEVRLPTEAEWERAARGTDGRIYPYGNEYDPTKGNTRDTGIGRTSAVGIFPDGASPEGVLDMSGNVWEWCQTQWRGSYDAPENNPAEGTAQRVVRGGSWLFSQVFARAVYRFVRIPFYRDDVLGFRVVVSSPI